ncbi:MAG TPA: hypothetical protein VK662_11850 [Acidothermaceae bacterium]|jgi:hypothetical protein|nr:hypothetical protein [Acidothermaceae bacterium]
MIKRPGRRVDALEVRTAEYPAARPPPYPAMPEVWRWPWLVATSVLTLTAGVLFVRTIPRVVQIGGSSDGGDFTAWVYRPQAGASLLAFGAGVVTMIVLALPLWKQRTRNVFFAVFAAFGLVAGLWGEHESAARRHIAPHLVAAVEAFHSPAGAIPSGPALLSSDGAFPLDNVLGEPSASRSWELPTNSAAAACTAVNRMIAGEPGWQPDPGWPCGFTRLQGRVFVRISDNQVGSTPADRIDVLAVPTDGSNY